jgi:GcrA cell cycle regulator
MPFAASWSDESVERLKTLWNEGLSCSRIARAINSEFSTLFTSNAVIGKIHRLGLGGRAPGGSIKVRTGGGMARTPRAPKPPRPAQLSAPEIAERLAQELPPTDDPFSPRGCRWPVGEVGADDFRFCQRPRGKRASGSESCWCPAHHALGTQRTRAA